MNIEVRSQRSWSKFGRTITGKISRNGNLSAAWGEHFFYAALKTLDMPSLKPIRCIDLLLSRAFSFRKRFWLLEAPVQGRPILSNLSHLSDWSLPLTSPKTNAYQTNCYEGHGREANYSSRLLINSEGQDNANDDAKLPESNDVACMLG